MIIVSHQNKIPIAFRDTWQSAIWCLPNRAVNTHFVVPVKVQASEQQHRWKHHALARSSHFKLRRKENLKAVYENWKSISYKEQVIGHTMTVPQLRFNAVWTWKLFLLNHARRNISISMKRYRNVDIWIRASSMPPSLHDKWYLRDISELLFSCLNKLIWWRRLGWMVGRKPPGAWWGSSKYCTIRFVFAQLNEILTSPKTEVD